jgi:Peptidase A4 family
MLRRWCILVAMLVVTAGTALAGSSASAATTGFTPSALGGYSGSLLTGPGPGWTPPGTKNFSPGGPVHLGAVKHARGFTTQAESTNWSGYAATGSSGTFTAVSASWTEPTGSCTSGDQYSAFWVGLDGYSSNTVEQTGSEFDCDGSTPEYYAWYEMYPGPSEDFSNTVKPGDAFTASVTYSTSTKKFTLTISDTSEPWTQTEVLSNTRAIRSSAEVIVEAPCCTFSGGILPLADFISASFAGSLANGVAIGSASNLVDITMVDSKRLDKDTISALTGGENFSATWVRSS